MSVRSQGYGRPGAKGADSTVPGPKGADSTVPGPKGADSTVPGATGKSAYEVAVAGGYAGTQAQWLASLKGDTGAAGQTLVGQVVIGQTAAIAIALGIREITVALAGAVAGERYACYCRSHKLNGGSSVAGRPSGYAVVDCVSNTAGQITVSLNAPLLAIGASYALTCDIVKVNAS